MARKARTAGVLFQHLGRVVSKLLYGVRDFHGGFEAPDTELTPAADRHVFDERRLHVRSRGSYSIYIGREVGLESFLGFAFDYDGFGEESVFEGVLRGDRFAFIGDGASGFGAVGSGCFGLFWLGMGSMTSADCAWELGSEWRGGVDYEEE